MGVTDAETQETTMSEHDKLTMKMFLTDCKERCLQTEITTSRLPTIPNVINMV